ncbi:MAG: Ryanodine receptor Ryr [Chromatiaceae bacterium]|nr:MAG: Ryanodine receptor Ryr [Chromatiaceae bacterium]
MSWSLGAPPILLAGASPLAAQVAAGLGRARRRFEQIADPAAVVPAPALLRRLQRALVLVLADPQDAAASLAALARACQRRAAGRAPLRVLLIHDTGNAAPAPLPLPAVPATLQLEQIDLAARAARLLLARWPLHQGADPGDDQAIHLIIAGRAPPAEALLVQALRGGHYGERPLHITLLAGAAAAWQRAFMAAYPQAGQIARLRFLGPDDPELLNGPPVSLVWVCPALPSAGLAVAIGLARQLAAGQGVSPPILLEVGATQPTGTLADWDGQIIPVSYRDTVLAPEVLLEARTDALAQVIHGHYRDSIEAQGRDPASEPAGQPWATLAESYRDANRQQADHLWAKLAVTDCRAVAEEQVESFAFTPVEVERLAQIEHARWAADRYLDGWSYAPVRDNARKQHPQLILYRDLSGPMQDLDRFAVRQVPALLARSSLGVVRMLILGLAPLPPGFPAAALTDARLHRRFGQILRRLLARYPARGLILASTLAEAPARRFAQRALDEAGAGLFLLGDRPLPALLAGLDAAARLETLALVARAERRIPLPAPGELLRWLHRRAEILLEFAPTATPRGTAAVSAAGAPKRVEIDPAGRLHWGFEY